VQRYAGIDIRAYPDQESLYEAARGRGAEVSPAMSRGKLIDALVKGYVDARLVQPTHLIDYPVDLSPLAKRKPDDPELVERFESYIGGNELANAFTELNDPLDQRARFEAQQAERAGGDVEAQPYDEDFVTALEHGMPPAGGIGVGIDRLAMVLGGVTNIRDVILFPQLRATRDERDDEDSSSS